MKTKVYDIETREALTAREADELQIYLEDSNLAFFKTTPILNAIGYYTMTAQTEDRAESAKLTKFLDSMCIANSVLVWNKPKGWN